MFVVAIILAILLALSYGMSGVQKVTGNAKAMEGADHIKVSHGFFKGIGVLELLGAIGLLVGIGVAAIGIAAGIGLVLLMIGAVIFHSRVKDSIGAMSPAIGLGIVALLEVIFRAASA